MAKQSNTPKKKKALAAAAPPLAPRWMGLLLALWAFLLYVNTLGHDYTQDDAIVITENVFTQQGLAGLPGIFKHDTFYGFFQDPDKAKLVSGGRYRPLSLATFAVEVELFGQRPFIGHLFNVLWYAFCCWVLFQVVGALLEERPSLRRYRWWVAFGTALLFASHPVHTEAVANIKGRDEILALLGSLGALWLAWRSCKKASAIGYVLAGVVFLLALLSKENAILFVVLGPLAFWVFKKKGEVYFPVHTLVFLLPALLFLFARSRVLGLGLGAPSMELMNNPFLKWENDHWIPFTTAERLAGVLVILGEYLRLMVWPWPLTHDYYPRHIGIHSLEELRVVLPLVIYAGMTAYGLWGAWKRQPLGYGLLFYLVTILLVSNLLFPLGTNLAERLLFMPSAGFLFALAWGAFQVRAAPRFILGGIVILALVLGALTINRNAVWKDNFTLFTTDIQTSPNSAKLRNAVGGELVTTAAKMAETNPQRKAYLQEAVGHLQEAIRIHPTYKNAYLLLGNAHYYLQNYDQALQAYEQALLVAPGYEEARSNLAITLRDAGRFYGEQKGDLKKALDYLKRAHELRPGDYETLRLLGIAYGNLGQHNASAQYFARAVEQQPGNAVAWYLASMAYQLSGEPEKAARYRQKALELDPDIAAKMGQ